MNFYTLQSSKTISKCFLLFLAIGQKQRESVLKRYNVRLFSVAEHLKGFIVIFENQQQEFFMRT